MTRTFSIDLVSNLKMLSRVERGTGRWIITIIPANGSFGEREARAFDALNVSRPVRKVSRREWTQPPSLSVHRRDKLPSSAHLQRTSSTYDLETDPRAAFNTGMASRNRPRLYRLWGPTRRFDNKGLPPGCRFAEPTTKAAIIRLVSEAQRHLQISCLALPPFEQRMPWRRKIYEHRIL